MNSVRMLPRPERQSGPLEPSNQARGAEVSLGSQACRGLLAPCSPFLPSWVLSGKSSSAGGGEGRGQPLGHILAEMCLVLGEQLEAPGLGWGRLAETAGASGPGRGLQGTFSYGRSFQAPSCLGASLWEGTLHPGAQVHQPCGCRVPWGPQAHVQRSRHHHRPLRELRGRRAPTLVSCTGLGSDMAAPPVPSAACPSGSSAVSPPATSSRTIHPSTLQGSVSGLHHPWS